MIKQEVTTDLVRELFTYDPATGVIAWRHKHWNKPAGTVAGSLHKSTGYWRLNIRSQKYQAHRIAWLMHYGEWPQVIDHVNGDRADNRIENLRSASHQTNAQNVHKPRKGTASSLLGASWHKSSGLWQAKI
jgi:HNH endonuclease